MTVLVMHSDELLLNAIQEHFERFLAENPPEVEVKYLFARCCKMIDAVEFFAIWQPRVVVINHRFSPIEDETGLEFVRQMKAGIQRKVDFCILSANGTVADQCRELDIDFILARPSQLNEVINYLKGLVAR